MSAAFKEWRIIVDLLGQGRQSLILRKGGLAEGRGGFAARHPRFWLFPTEYHQQTQKTKPAAAGVFAAAPPAPGTVTLEFWADNTEAIWVSSWEKLAGLQDWHGWTEETVRERFDYEEPKGLHVLIVRVYRALTRTVLPMRQEFGGCKSWIEVPVDFSRPAVPVLAEEDFARQRKKTLSLLKE